jgi:uncharacterized repeat protein (TIGR01451 family)
VIWKTAASGTPERLYGVWGSSGSDVFAVGDYGTILHYDGETWSAMDSGTTRDLSGVWGSRGDDVFAVGANGTVLHYDGATWSAMDSGNTSDLWGIWGSSGANVFAVGGSTILHYNGLAWSAMSSGTIGWLRGVWGSSASNVFAVGSMEYCEAEPGEWVCWYGAGILHYDGASWDDGWGCDTRQEGPLESVWGSGGGDVFAVGDYGTILHYDSAMDSGTDTYLTGVWGSDGGDVFTVGSGGTILHYDGVAWSPMDSGTREYLYGVWGSSGSDVFAVGQYGTILHYDGTPLAKAVQPGPAVGAGAPITYTLAFWNTSAVTATHVILTDVIPLEVSRVTVTSSRPVTPSGTLSYTWLLGDLPPQAKGVITIAGVVGPELPAGHVFTNTATMTSATGLGGGDRVQVTVAHHMYLPLALKHGHR